MKIQFGDCTLDWASRQLSRAGAPVHLSPKALALLKILVDSRPRAVSKAELHKSVWPDTFISDATLTSLVAEVRKGIGDRARPARFVRTVHGFGYAFSGAATVSSEPPALRPARVAGYWVTWGGGQVALREGENILGRDRDVTVWLDSLDVSRRHARISIAGKDPILEDLGSRNGTFLRGERITSPRPLANGDEIGLGSVVVTFRVSQADASTQTQASRARRTVGRTGD